MCGFRPQSAQTPVQPIDRDRFLFYSFRVLHADGACGWMRACVDGCCVAAACLLACLLSQQRLTEIGFGETFNSLRGFQAIGNSFDDAQELMFRRMLRPFFDSIIGKIIYPEERRMAKRIAELDAFSANLIRKRRNAMEAASERQEDPGGKAEGATTGTRKPFSKRSASVGQDILSLFMDPRFTTTQYTDKQLQNIIMSVLLAGRDTTAATLAYSIAELMMHPAILKQLRAEFAQRLGHTECSCCCDGSTAPVTMEDVTQRNMPYVRGHGAVSQRWCLR